MSNHPITITTSFGLSDTVYIRSEAQYKGRLAGGPVTRVNIRIGDQGHIVSPEILYGVRQSVVIEPSDGWWREFELCDEATASQLASDYHAAKAQLHGQRSRSLQQ